MSGRPRAWGSAYRPTCAPTLGLIDGESWGADNVVSQSVVYNETLRLSHGEIQLPTFLMSLFLLCVGVDPGPDTYQGQPL